MKYLGLTKLDFHLWKVEGYCITQFSTRKDTCQATSDVWRELWGEYLGLLTYLSVVFHVSHRCSVRWYLNRSWFCLTVIN